MVKERDTYKYHLKKGKKVVHRGITYDLELREAQHQEEYPGSRIKQVGRKTKRDAALKWAREGGKRPYKKWPVESSGLLEYPHNDKNNYFPFCGLTCPG